MIQSYGRLPSGSAVTIGKIDKNKDSHEQPGHSKTNGDDPFFSRSGVMLSSPSAGTDEARLITPVR
jgi:hypothetical protein